MPNFTGYGLIEARAILSVLIAIELEFTE